MNGHAPNGMEISVESFKNLLSKTEELLKTASERQFRRFLVFMKTVKEMHDRICDNDQTKVAEIDTPVYKKLQALYDHRKDELYAWRDEDFQWRKSYKNIRESVQLHNEAKNQPVPIKLVRKEEKSGSNLELLKRRHPLKDESKSPIPEDNKLTEKYTQDILDLTRNLKHNFITTSNIIKNDFEKINESVLLMSKNELEVGKKSQFIKSEKDKLDAYVLPTILMISIIVFFITVIFMRTIDKNS
ncbi:hypothetical protein RF11_05580 [Thelohanellus kitauei]|uniref:Vesicle transport protein USE1 n=1 Tax=Thelohanellus kitauei TaxID=669202 RepID=A0A0C2MFL7_THEKT|nr:hypothetical protein RF11_05580 [Thelohanellus kitauei]